MDANQTSLEVIFERLFREILRDKLKSISSGKEAELLTPEELAAKLKVPRSWVYEQSRRGKIPTHRIGRYLRFDLAAVVASQKTLK